MHVIACLAKKARFASQCMPAVGMTLISLHALCIDQGCFSTLYMLLPLLLLLLLSPVYNILLFSPNTGFHFVGDTCAASNLLSFLCRSRVQ